MLCQWMSGSQCFAGLWCCHFQGSSRPIAVFLGLLTLKTKASQSFKTVGSTLSLTQQHSCTFWKTSVLSIATVRTWNLAQLHLYHSTECLLPHYNSLHCHFVSWGTVFGPYVRNWNTADISLGICCCLVLYSAMQLSCNSSVITLPTEHFTVFPSHTTSMSSTHCLFLTTSCSKKLPSAGDYIINVSTKYSCYNYNVSWHLCIRNSSIVMGSFSELELVGISLHCFVHFFFCIGFKDKIMHRCWANFLFWTVIFSIYISDITWRWQFPAEIGSGK